MNIPRNILEEMDESSPKGLPNIGNSCYINAVLQVLASSPRLLRNLQHSSQDQSQKCVSRVLCRLLLFVSSTTGNAEVRRDIRKLHSLVLGSESPIEAGESNDAHFFLMHLIGKLKDERMIEIINMFRIQLCDLIEQKFCKCIEVTTEQSFYSLSLPLSTEEMSVKGGLDILLQEEVLTLNCRRCADTEGSCIKRLYIRELPELLILQLPRFKEDSKTQRRDLLKMSSKIRFSSELELRDADHKKHAYVLYGLIEHIGDLHSGHYIAYVLKFLSGHKRIWYRCSDEDVTPTPEDYIYSLRDVYLLFYAHR